MALQSFIEPLNDPIRPDALSKRALQGFEYCRRRSDKQTPEIDSPGEFCHQQHSNQAYLVLLSTRLRGKLIADLPSTCAAWFSFVSSAHPAGNTTRDRSRRDFLSERTDISFFFSAFYPERTVKLCSAFLHKVTNNANSCDC